MLLRIRRLLNSFFSRSSTINNEPLNKVSLIVIILIDIFILINVFNGLEDISRWHITPSQSYPCYSEWRNYRAQTTQDKDYELLKATLTNETNDQPSQKNYQQVEEGHLGKVSEACLNYATYKDKINNSLNQQTLKVIAQKQDKVSTFEQANRQIRTQYDSTLLEKIASQPRDRSINAVGAEKAKQKLEQNDRAISTLDKEVFNLKQELVTKPESSSWIAFLKDNGKFEEVEKGYQQASFWYPSIQFTLQAFFLLPLILVALAIHRFAQRRGYGLIALMSWHLLVIFFIPLLLKVFELLQVGVLFKFAFNILSALFSGLLFLVSYVYILLIPLVGFGIIKFFQKIVFNTKGQVASRVQKSRCMKCSRRIKQHDFHCPHCGYYQYVECQSCRELTYKHLPYCRQCGYSQDLSQL